MAKAATVSDHHPGLATSGYDKTSNLLTATILVLGVIVAVGLALWWMQRPAALAKRSEFRPLSLAPAGGGQRENTDFLEPAGGHELADAQVALEVSLQDISHVVAAHGETLDREAGHGSLGPTTDNRRGRESGPETGPGPGPLSPDVFDRWEVRYSTANRGEYAKQLDHFGIVVAGIMRRGPMIVYASELSDLSPVLSEGRKSLEKRAFFNFQQGRLVDWDREFLAESRWDPEDYLLVQFYPDAVIELLFELERDAAQVPLDELRRTVFGVREIESGYEFYVIEQR